MIPHSTFYGININAKIKVARLLLLLLLGLASLTACNRETPVITANIPPTMLQAVATQPGETQVPPTSAPAMQETPASKAPAAPPAGMETPAESVIDAANAASLQTTGQISESEAHQFTWLPDSQTLALATENEIILHPSDPAAETTQISAAVPSMLVSSPDQNLLAWADEQNSVRVWNVSEARELFTLSGNTAVVTGLAFSPQGDRLAAATYDNKVNIWDLANGELIKTWELAYWLSNLAYSPDGASLAGADLPNFTVYLLDSTTGQEQRTLTWNEGASPALYAAVFSPDWRRIAWVARGTVQLMDVASGELGPTLSHEDFVNTVAWSPDSSLLASSSAATIDDNFSPVVVVWDGTSGETVNVLAQEEPVLGLAFSPDGSRLASLNSSGTLQLWAEQ